jgi:hypothetical protein
VYGAGSGTAFHQWHAGPDQGPYKPRSGPADLCGAYCRGHLHGTAAGTRTVWRVLTGGPGRQNAASVA